ncbi:hypothetical protein H312_00127 [Anncaliia algerae PRA339]|uniref:Uncharacterized protein n=1 Tax=Anncaliia algerae PRA339 TaxID=1288291 RepID=A0A059F635_9MICR|nr:hypothetical protein H312_00127 [Anncaliia algerae PRA339]
MDRNTFSNLFRVASAKIMRTLLFSSAITVASVLFAVLLPRCDLNLKFNITFSIFTKYLDLLLVSYFHFQDYYSRNMVIIYFKDFEHIDIDFIIDTLTDHNNTYIIFKIWLNDIFTFPNIRLFQSIFAILADIIFIQYLQPYF